MVDVKITKQVLKQISVSSGLIEFMDNNNLLGIPLSKVREIELYSGRDLSALVNIDTLETDKYGNVTRYYSKDGFYFSRVYDNKKRSFTQTDGVYCEYDENWNITLYQSKDATNRLIWWRAEYDKNDNSLFFEDSSGHVYEKKVNDLGLTTEYKVNGVVHEKTRYDDNGNVLAYYNISDIKDYVGSDKDYRWKNTKGQIIFIHYACGDYYHYLYDKRGNMVFEIIYNASRDIKQTIRYDHVFYPNGQLKANDTIKFIPLF